MDCLANVAVPLFATLRQDLTACFPKYSRRLTATSETNITPEYRSNSGRNPAKQLAFTLVDRIAIITGGGFLAPVARRWKAQLNENGKAAAAFDELPEATHNTVVGFEQPESLRDHLVVVFLTSTLDHPRTLLRAGVIAGLLASANVAHEVVEATGTGRLGHALSTISLGDYVSVYVAFMYAVDPTPVVAIDHIKARLAEADAPSA